MKKLLALVFFLFVVFITVVGQPPPDDPPGDPPPDQEVPITGIEILIGLGSAFGAKKFLERKKKE